MAPEFPELEGKNLDKLDVVFEVLPSLASLKLDFEPTENNDSVTSLEDLIRYLRGL